MVGTPNVGIGGLVLPSVTKSPSLAKNKKCVSVVTGDSVYGYRSMKMNTYVRKTSDR